MAIGIEKATGQRRVRFTSGVSHNGVDYGPGYDEQECELDARSAAEYVREGRAVYIGDDTPPEKETISGSAGAGRKERQINGKDHRRKYRPCH
jgi:hypothetical protein